MAGIVEENRKWLWLFSAMAGASFVVITQLATRDQISPDHFKSVCSFAFALPILAESAWSLRRREKGKVKTIWAALASIVLMLAGTATFIRGMWFLMAGFGPNASTCFQWGLFVTLLCGTIIDIDARRKKRLNQ